MPVTRDPTAEMTEPPGGAAPRSDRCSTSGSNTTRKPSTLARIQPGRSTTATRPSSGEPGRPVSSRTGSATSAASCRSSATTFLASDSETAGPGLTHRTPVAVATSQSIICTLLTPPPYVPWPPSAPQARAHSGSRAGSGRLSSAITHYQRP